MTGTRSSSGHAPWVLVGVESGHAVIAEAAEASIPERIPVDELGSYVRRREDRGDGPRWVWADTATVYPPILASGVSVARCRDLRLCHAILRDGAADSAAKAALAAARLWDRAVPQDREAQPGLFDLEVDAALAPDPRTFAQVSSEAQRQQRVLEGGAGRARGLDLLCAAESAGALIAVEMSTAGIPWDRAVHERLLVAKLGERTVDGSAPARLRAAADRVREALGDPRLNVDSPARLLRALHRAGIDVDSTGRSQLAAHDHPAIAPLLEYRALARLHSANGWHWLDEWVRDGRFHPVYIPAGVVTGRWAAAGGGALQIPRELRRAVRADPGWCLISADVSQLEPRVMAAMSSDRRLAADARGRDLYAAVAERGALASRAEAKIAVLGAMYGSTTGSSGRLVHGLRRTYPKAMGLVDAAARAGERGQAVSTWLGRSSGSTSPRPQTDRVEGRSTLSVEDRDASARRRAAERGRFTRNFVIQGTAAEWALVWLAEVRAGLAALPEDTGHPAHTAPVFATRAHLVFFLHDELIVHAPQALAPRVSALIEQAAQTATRRLFGHAEVDFPLDMHVGPDASGH